MFLQLGNRPLVANRALNPLPHRLGLARAGRKNAHLARVEDGADADGQRHARHLALVAVEKARVGRDRRGDERLQPRARGERRAGLVERDVPVRAHAAEEQVDAAEGGDLGFVAGWRQRGSQGGGMRWVIVGLLSSASKQCGECILAAFRLEIARHAVEDVHVLRLDVDVRKEMRIHERVVGLGVVSGQADVFVLHDG